MKPLKSILYLLLLSALMGCNKGMVSSNNADNQKDADTEKAALSGHFKAEGVLQDYSGMDGCGWVIISDDKTYEPINLNEFDIALEDGNKIKFSFEKADGSSICMAGKMIRLITIN